MLRVSTQHGVYFSFNIYETFYMDTLYIYIHTIEGIYIKNTGLV